jgi:hypothetical protein
MRKIILSLLAVAALAVAAFVAAPAVIGGGAVEPDAAKATDTGYNPPVRSCWSAWYRTSDHYPNSTLWYHCHYAVSGGKYYYRVHTCRSSPYTYGILHAQTVRKNGGSDYNIDVYNHQHAYRGEGCGG